MCTAFLISSHTPNSTNTSSSATFATSSQLPSESQFGSCDSYQAAWSSGMILASGTHEAQMREVPSSTLGAAPFFAGSGVEGSYLFARMLSGRFCAFVGLVEALSIGCRRRAPLVWEHALAGLSLGLVLRRKSEKLRTGHYFPCDVASECHPSIPPDMTAPLLSACLLLERLKNAG